MNGGFLLVLLLVPVQLKGGNNNLFDSSSRRDFHTFSDPINVGIQGNRKRLISPDRFKRTRFIFPCAFAKTEKQSDPWYMILDMLDGFNENRKEWIAASATKTHDECMSAIRPRTTATSTLPNLSFINRKPEPLGSEFKATCGTKVGNILKLEVQRGKVGMVNAKYNKKYGATTGCTLRLTEATQYCGTRSNERKMAAQNFKSELFLEDSWFGSVKAVEQQKCMHFDDDGNPAGHEVIAALKTNSSLFPKKEIEEKMKDYPSGSQLVFVCKTPVNKVDLVAIGYKYNARKTLCFIATKNAGSTRPGNPYIARFPDQYSNVTTRDVERPAIISKYFENSNKVDVANHVRQFLLRLEKLWVTKDPYFRINTTIIGMTVTDAWLLARYQSNNQNVKKMKVTDFADRLAWDCTHNPHSKNKNGSGSSNSFIPSNEDQSTEVYISGNEISINTGELSFLQSTISPLSQSALSIYNIAHNPIISDDKDNSGRTRRRRCNKCRALTVWKCNHPVCASHIARYNNCEYEGTFFCIKVKKGESKSCLQLHQEDMAGIQQR